MLRTRSFLWLAIIFLLLVCTACQHQNTDNSAQSSIAATSGNDSAQHIQRTLDTNLSINAEVSAPSNVEKLNTLLVNPLKMNTQQVQALKTQLISNSNITQNNHGFIQTVDGKELFNGTNNLNFHTKKFTYIKPVFCFLPNELYYNADKFKRNQDLSFMPYQKAVEEVKIALTSLGISLDDKVETYSLDYQTMQAQEKIKKANGELTDPRDGSITLKDRWSEEDNCYFMIFRSSLDYVPVYPKSHGHVENNTLVSSDYIYACYSKDGLEYLSINFPYQKTSIDQKDMKIISVEEALAAVKRKYSNVILTDPTTITDIELYYVPTLISQSRDEFRMVPAWCFELGEGITYGDGTHQTVPNTVIIDANTGGEIL
ncbi:hypothetical protein [Desulfosporosinus shakirovi]|uniref:hypothetical protein n=1 Tax=Desulfosporosinus shakirovi TaxID=2885154 RepID=UPI001E5611C8|nr:hypothetical protein [Desulfosporosinus sp. SRJS8]MCB8818089.1 hypothetical protein [Desulfosporosinus sp. SRJS8]